MTKIILTGLFINVIQFGEEHVQLTYYFGIM